MLKIGFEPAISQRLSTVAVFTSYKTKTTKVADSHFTIHICKHGGELGEEYFRFTFLNCVTVYLISEEIHALVLTVLNLFITGWEQAGRRRKRARINFVTAVALQGTRP